jgi:hypothetical protein
MKICRLFSLRPSAYLCVLGKGSLRRRGRRDPQRAAESVAAVFFCLLMSIVAIVASPSKQTPRKIVSDDFTKNRVSKMGQNSKGSQTQSTGQNHPKPPVQQTYLLASASKPKRTPRPRQPVVAQLGLTIWRLRPMTAADKGATVIVKENETQSKWVAERVEADTVFRKGDFVRLSIESPHIGYLYVVNRDQFAGDTVGDPMVIYPWGGMARGENRVQPGRLIDIPSQEDVPSYFMANPTKANQVGELLTFIITKTPLDLPISDNPLRLSKEQFAQWLKMWKSDNDRFEMEGGAGKLWTDEERQAGSRVRSRQLTRTDPAPQTIYRVTASNNTGYVVHVRLAYAR